ncbi:MAG: Holliday junction branch migration protein RuvA [Synergistota bacterium]|jgi:Holliday junction DNA helicase RuvA|nr:Holliday junction branch migration protein RuvA [Synergistota bacterium]OPZ40131.1 MAG: Holliday junction ATP-dependent DNA helicase RuvA [Synergistetes bacterium ADurb.BinA166]
MLRFLSGKVRSVCDNQVVLDVGGIGFELLCTGRATAQCSEGDAADLVTHLQFSESGPTLFGFCDERERALFLRLVTIKGIGGKMAMNILKNTPPDRFISWVLSSDIDAMTKIPGVGRKTAERLCFEMRPYLAEEGASLLAESSFSDRLVSTAAEALRSLGFSASEVGEAFSRLRRSGLLDGEELTDERLVRLALKELKKN